MRIAIPVITLGLLAAAGCQQTPPKAATDSAAMDLAPMASTPAPTPYVAPPADPALSVSATPPINAVVASANSYTIKPGDTLWKIAASHYGDGKKWKEICDANPGLTPSQLRIGQTIALP